MQDFARNVAVLLNQRGVPLPDEIVTSSEQGQPGISDWDNKFGSRFNELIATSPNLKAIMVNKHTIKVSNPSMLVPNKKDPTKWQQISGIVTPSFSEIG